MISNRRRLLICRRAVVAMVSIVWVGEDRRMERSCVVRAPMDFEGLGMGLGCWGFGFGGGGGFWGTSVSGAFMGETRAESMKPCIMLRGTDLLGFFLGFRASRRGCIGKVVGWWLQSKILFVDYNSRGFLIYIYPSIVKIGYDANQFELQLTLKKFRDRSKKKI
jgi:hypothetical protein